MHVPSCHAGHLALRLDLGPGSRQRVAGRPMTAVRCCPWCSLWAEDSVWNWHSLWHLSQVSLVGGHHRCLPLLPPAEGAETALHGCVNFAGGWQGMELTSTWFHSYILWLGFSDVCDKCFCTYCCGGMIVIPGMPSTIDW